MSTPPEDNDPFDRTDPAGDEPGPNPPETPAADSGAPSFVGAHGGTRPDTDDAGAEGSGEAVPAQAPDRSSGLLSAETFALTALALFAMTVFSGQLVQLFTTVTLIGDQPVPEDQVAQFSTQVLIGGGLALLTALVAVLALVLSGPRSRPWARWVAGAMLIASLLLLLMAIVTYVQMPAGTAPPQPVIPE